MDGAGGREFSCDLDAPVYVAGEMCWQMALNQRANPSFGCRLPAPHLMSCPAASGANVAHTHH